MAYWIPPALSLHENALHADKQGEQQRVHPLSSPLRLVFQVRVHLQRQELCLHKSPLLACNPSVPIQQADWIFHAREGQRLLHGSVLRHQGHTLSDGTGWRVRRRYEDIEAVSLLPLLQSKCDRVHRQFRALDSDQVWVRFQPLTYTFLRRPRTALK